jgi:hypothetical protein
VHHSSRFCYRCLQKWHMCAQPEWVAWGEKELYRGYSLVSEKRWWMGLLLIIAGGELRWRWFVISLLYRLFNISLVRARNVIHNAQFDSLRKRIMDSRCCVLNSLQNIVLNYWRVRVLFCQCCAVLIALYLETFWSSYEHLNTRHAMFRANYNFIEDV